MKTKKTFLMAFFLLMLAGIFNSCDLLFPNSKEETKTSVWKLVSTEIWWVAPTDGNHTLEKIASVPFGQTFAYSGVWQAIYSGAEFDLTRTDKFNGTILGTINYTWSQFPDYIDPGIEFTCTIESKGTQGNGIGVSNSATTIGGWPAGYGVWTQSFRNGPKTAKLTIAKPSDVTVSSQMKFIMDLSSGGYFYISYYYIYEWIPE